MTWLCGYILYVIMTCLCGYGEHDACWRSILFVILYAVMCVWWWWWWIKVWDFLSLCCRIFLVHVDEIKIFVSIILWLTNFLARLSCNKATASLQAYHYRNVLSVSLTHTGTHIHTNSPLAYACAHTHMHAHMDSMNAHTFSPSHHLHKVRLKWWESTTITNRPHFV